VSVRVYEYVSAYVSVSLSGECVECVCMCLKHNLGDIREVSKANHQLLMVKGGGKPTSILNVCFHVNKYLIFVIVTAVVVVKVVPIKTYQHRSGNENLQTRYR